MSLLLTATFLLHSPRARWHAATPRFWRFSLIARHEASGLRHLLAYCSVQIGPSCQLFVCAPVRSEGHASNFDDRLSADPINSTNTKQQCPGTFLTARSTRMSSTSTGALHNLLVLDLKPCSWIMKSWRLADWVAMQTCNSSQRSGKDGPQSAFDVRNGMAPAWSAAVERLGTLRDPQVSLDLFCCCRMPREGIKAVCGCLDSQIRISTTGLLRVVWIRPEPHILLFRRVRGTDPLTGLAPAKMAAKPAVIQQQTVTAR